MLSTDTIILDILNDAKLHGNKLLQYFHIQHPSNRIVEEDNNIFIACVSTENREDGFEFSSFKDLVEILIVTKQLEYSKAITLIKTVSNEICRLIMINQDKFPTKPVIRNINPEFNNDFVLTRGHIMIEVNTEPVTFDVDEETYQYVCNVILEEMEIDD